MDISNNLSQLSLNNSSLPIENKAMTAGEGISAADASLVQDSFTPLFSSGLPSDTLNAAATMPNITLASRASRVEDVLESDESVRRGAKSLEDRRKPDHTEPDDDNEPSYDMPGMENLIRLTILHTNDIHGTAEKLPALSSTISTLKKENPDAVIVDAGDIAYSAKPTEDDPFLPMVGYLNDNNYLCVVPGNHDFQWGKEMANEFFKKLKPDVLAGNILDKETGKPLPNSKPFVIKEINGVKVGFLGITTTKMATNEHPDIGDDLIVFGETETLQRDVRLAKEQGAEVLVAIMHKGFNDVKDIKCIAKKVPDLDLIITAHDHKVEKTSIRTGEFPHRTYIVEAGAYGNYVGSVTLMVDPATKHVMKANMKAWPTEKYEIVAPPATRTPETPEAPGI